MAASRAARCCLVPGALFALSGLGSERGLVSSSLSKGRLMGDMCLRLVGGKARRTQIGVALFGDAKSASDTGEPCAVSSKVRL
jgi:hypothetical protein